MIRRSSIALAMVTVWLGAFASTSWAGRFVDLPPLGGKGSSLEIRFVRYTGGTNGKMVVELRNPTKHKALFTARGLYFVPNGDPEKAPQRLGAAGPFERELQGSVRQSQRLWIAPGQRVELRLQVFCIDSHRSSPRAHHTFRIAKRRLPKKLRSKIVRSTSRIVRKHKGVITPAAKAEMQSQVWTKRNEKWIALEGERAREKAPRKPGYRRPLKYRLPTEQRQALH